MNNRNDTERFNRNILELNIKRAFTSTVVLAVVLPVIFVAALVCRWDNDTLRSLFVIGTAILEAIQFIFMVVIRFQCARDEFDTYRVIYLVYYAVTITFLMLGAGCDMEAFGSELLYFSACMYLVFVPVFTETERIAFVAGQTIIMLPLVIGFRINVRGIVDVCIVQFLTILLSGYQHNVAVKRQKMGMKLKKKTDTSEHDALTGLYNRRGLESRINAIWAFCERNKIPVGVLTLDIDYFKKYNDKFGHPKGDECLRQVAKVLKASAQRSTDVVTRTGGEEFIIFVQDVDDDNLVALASKIRKNLEEQAIPQAYLGVSKYVTVSIGIASFVPGYNKDFDRLYEEADAALYQAKKNGRNCIVYKGNVYGRIKNGVTKATPV